MGKRKAAADNQKFTNKNITFNYVVNTNDEAVPGFSNISDIDPNKIAKSVVPRPGIKQSELFPLSISNSPSGFVYPVNEYSNGTPTVTGSTKIFEDLINYTDITDGYCKPNMIFTAINTYAIQGIFIEFQGKWTTPISNNIYLQIYDFDMSTNVLGNLLGSSGQISVSASLDGTSNTMKQSYFSITNNSTYNEPVRLENGKSYMIKIIFITPIKLTSSTSLLIEKGVADINNFSLISTSYPTQPTLYTPTTSAWFLTMGIYTISQAKQNINITSINSIEGTNAQTLISRQVNPLNNAFGYGCLDTLTPTTKTTGTDKSYPVIALTDLILPAMTPTSNPIPYVLNNTMITGVVNPILKYSGQSGYTAPVVDSLGTKYPAAYYGVKVQNSVHDYGCFLGSQLANKATVNDDNYPMFKRAEGDTYFSEITADVYPSFSDPIPTKMPNSYPDYANNGGFIQIKYDETNNGTTTTDSNQLFPGNYEYAIEFIDKTGYPYSTDYENTTIIKTSSNAIATYNAYVAANNKPINFPMPVAMGYFIATTYIGIPIPLGPIPNATPEDYPIINIYRRGTTYVELSAVSDNPTGAVFTVIKTPDSEFQLIDTLYPADYSTAWPTWSVATGRPSPNPRMGYWYYKDTTPYSELGQTTLDQKDYYVPRPADFEIYMGHTIAAGDPQYPNFIFPSSQYKCDFRVENQISVIFPKGDTYFTAVTSLNQDCFIFSKKGTWRLRYMYTNPQPMLQQISNRLGCVSTSKGIVKYGQKLLIPTIEGLMWFDGYNYSPADDQLNFIWESIDYDDTLIQTGGNPNLTVGHVPSFEVVGIYDSLTKNVLYSMPETSLSIPKTIYSFNTKIGQWSLYDLNNVKNIYQLELNNTIGYFTNSDIAYQFDRKLFMDYLSDCGLISAPINSTLKSTMIDFGETTTYKGFRIWGNGLVNVNFYFDRETTPTSSYTSIDLSSQNSIGYSFDMGWTGNYFQFEITALDPNFELKAFELIYSNEGIKEFKNVASE